VRTTKTQVANLSFSCGVVLVTLLGMVLLDAGGWGLIDSACHVIKRI
jgi:hypothetical protein